VSEKRDWVSSPKIPLFKMLGIEVLEAEPDKSKLRYHAKPEFFNGSGVIQGGIVTIVLV
jgi:acyl-coenzyme A thioesterase PaaI-like protein